MNVELIGEFKYFYRIFNGGMDFKEYRYVGISKQNYIFIEKEWWPLEDFDWVSSETKLDDPVGEWMKRIEREDV